MLVSGWLDLAGIELLAADPVDGLISGRIYKNTVTGLIRIYDLPSTSWITFVTEAATQTLTNKEFEGGTATNARRLTVPSNTYVNLLALTRKAGVILYATDQTKMYFDNGTTLVELRMSSFVNFDAHLIPDLDNTHDIGSVSLRVKDLYTSGQAIGLRAQNFANFAAFPAASGAQIGRMAYDVAEKDLYIDFGGTWKRASVDYYSFTDAVNWNGSISTFTYTVDATIPNTRSMVWTFKSLTGDYEQMIGASIKFPLTTTVQITFDTPPPAGTYILIGVG